MNDLRVVFLLGALDVAETGLKVADDVGEQSAGVTISTFIIGSGLALMRSLRKGDAARETSVAGA